MDNSGFNVETLENLAEKVRARKHDPTRPTDSVGAPLAVLLGAGASLSAGIPLADDIVKEAFRKYPRVLGRCQREYPAVMSKLDPCDRDALLRPFVQSATINPAHLYLSRLVKEHYVDRILTTNFDPLAVQGLVLGNIRPIVYDVPNLREVSAGTIFPPAVIHLHGQFGSYFTLHTPKETDEFVHRAREILKDTLETRALIVVGYGGTNDPVFDILSEHGLFHHGLYWVSHTTNPPPDHVFTGLLANPARHAYYIQGLPADDFFIRLVAELELNAPEIVDRPFSFVREAIEAVSLGDLSSTSVLKRSKEWIDDAILCREMDELCQKGKDNVTRVCLVSGKDMIKRSGLAGQEEARRLLLEAEQDLRRILRSQPESMDALTYLGRTLWRRSRNSPINDARGLLTDAMAQLRKVVGAYSPIDNYVFFPSDGNVEELDIDETVPRQVIVAMKELGHVLLAISMCSEGDNAIQFLAEGIKTFETCQRLAPSFAEVVIDEGAGIVECSCVHSSEKVIAVLEAGICELGVRLSQPILKASTRKALRASFECVREPGQVPSPYLLSAAFAAVDSGYKERALDLLELSHSQGDVDFVHDKRFESLQGTSRWKEIAGPTDAPYGISWTRRS